MENCQKVTLSTATVYHTVKNNVFIFRMRGLLTVATMREFQACLAAQMKQYPVIVADYTGATIAYSPHDKWLDPSMSMMFAVLVRKDQVKQFQSIAKARAKTGCIRIIFTDAHECEAWALQEYFLRRPDSSQRELWAA